jgi:hypothetical protein
VVLVGDKCEKALIEGLLADWTEPEPKSQNPENQLFKRHCFPGKPTWKPTFRELESMGSLYVLRGNTKITVPPEISQ